VKCRERTCKAKDCTNKFLPFNSIQQWCSPACGYAISKAKTDHKARKDNAAQKRIEKAERKVFRQRKQAIKPSNTLLSEAQKAFNEYCRYRDMHRMCINEGIYVPWDGNESDAAHYVSRASNGAMRFDLRNVNKSTKASNANQEKWIHDYKVNLEIKLGSERFKQFEDDCKYWKVNKRTFNNEYLVRIKTIFRKKKRVLMKIREIT